MTDRGVLRVALAGAGMVSRHHLKAWSRLPGVEMVGICARRLERAQARAAEHPGLRPYASVEEMLDRERPHALDVASPPEAHAEHVELAADRGVHVLCQKPMAPTLAEAESLVARVGDRVRFMVHENWRFRPYYRQVAAWIAQGRVGPIREFRLTTRSSGLVTRTESGRPFALERQPFMAHLRRFVILELLVHHLDTVRFLAGPMRVVAARAARVSPDVVGEDLAVILLEAQSGALGAVSGNLSAAGAPPLPRDRLELLGEEGSVLLEADALTLEGSAPETLRFDLDAAYQASYDNAIAHFAEALRAGTPFETDRLDNLETLRLVAAAYGSAGLRVDKTPGGDSPPRGK